MAVVHQLLDAFPVLFGGIPAGFEQCRFQRPLGQGGVAGEFGGQYIELLSKVVFRDFIKRRPGRLLSPQFHH